MAVTVTLLLCALQAVIPVLDAAAWRKSKHKKSINHEARETCIRLALARLETMMRTHLQFLAEQDCARSNAPSSQTKHVLRRAFWKVDPGRTEHVSLQQFLQVRGRALRCAMCSASTAPRACSGNNAADVLHLLLLRATGTLLDDGHCASRCGA